MKIESVKEVAQVLFRAFKISVVCVLALAFVSTSCKKDDEEEDELLRL